MRVAVQVDVPDYLLGLQWQCMACSMYGMGKTARKISTTIYLHPYQQENLRRLSDATRVPASSFIRQGVDMVLEANEEILKKDDESSETQADEPTETQADDPVAVEAETTEEDPVIEAQAS